MKQHIFFLFAGLMLSTAHSAGFDCAKANTKQEKLICNNKALSDLDSKLDTAYKQTLKVLMTSLGDQSQAQQLVADQQKWLSQTRNACNDEGCLNLAYESRIMELGAPLLINGVTVNYFNGVAVFWDPSSRTDSFNQSIKANGKPGKILQCKTLIDIPSARGGRDIGMGGYCTYQENSKNENVFICNDDLVGNFKLEKIDHEPSNQELIDFILSYCGGG